MKKINIFIGIGIGLIIIAVVWGILSGKIDRFVPHGEVKISQEKVDKKVVLIIDDGEELLSKAIEIETEFKERMTAFNLLSDETEKLNLTLKFKTYDMGVFIEAIGDKENGKDGKYWLYYVNGEMPQLAVDKQLLNPGDKVEFKFEKSPF
jgi:hypothetical protein